MSGRIRTTAFVLLFAFSVSAAAEDPATTSAKTLSRAFRSAANEAIPSVVTVVAKVKRSRRRVGDLGDLLRDPRLRRLFPDGLPDELQPDDSDDQPGDDDNVELDSNLGSGVIIKASGVVLTNAHVVNGADSVIVRLHGGREVPVTKVQSDSLSDLAILHIDTDLPLKPAKLGDSGDLAIGDWVIAIGSPFELDTTVSAGIISGKGRGIDKIQRGRLLQTDAAINPGNSGGPLVNLDGEVVGINTAIASSSGGYQGIGFAIPANRAQWVSQELATHGKVRRAWLGIRIGEVTPEAVAQLKLEDHRGVWVLSVAENSPAAESGMQKNDVIVEFAGERVRGPRDLQDVVEQKPIGSKQAVKVSRTGKPVTLNVVMKSLPDDVNLPRR